MVLVIGGGKRIGKALVEAYAHKNRVLFTYHSSVPKLKKVSTATGVQLDLRERSAIQSFVKSLKNKSVSCVLYVASTFDQIKFGKTTEEEWANLVDVNLKAAYFLCETIRPKLNSGANIQFFNDVLIDRLPPSRLPYSMAKAGLSILAKTLARAWAPEIRVNEIGLGYALLPDETSETHREKWLEEVPLKRFSGVKPVISASQFLTEQTYITGTRIDVDGGLSLVR